MLGGCYTVYITVWKITIDNHSRISFLDQSLQFVIQVNLHLSELGTCGCVPNPQSLQPTSVLRQNTEPQIAPSAVPSVYVCDYSSQSASGIRAPVCAWWWTGECRRRVTQHVDCWERPEKCYINTVHLPFTREWTLLNSATLTSEVFTNTASSRRQSWPLREWRSIESYKHSVVLCCNFLLL